MPSTNATSSAYKWHRWLFITAVAVQLLVACASIVLMSSVRVFVSGESLWSKGLSSAFMHLDRYAESGASEDFNRFQQSLAIPLGVSQARQALDAGSNNIQIMRDGLLQGENHPADIDSLLRVLPYFWSLAPLEPIQALWRSGDQYVFELEALAQQIKQQRSTYNTIESHTVQTWQSQISAMNNAVMPLAKQFSAKLGSKSRQLGNILLMVNLLTALALSLLYLFSLHRAINESNRAYNALEVERMRSNITLAALGDGVLNLDNQCRIRYANPAAAKLLNTDRQQLLGQTIYDVLPFAGEILPSYEQALRSANTLHHKDDNVHWMHIKDKERVAIQISVTALVQDEQPTGLVLVLHDVSQEQNYMRMLLWQQSHDLLTGLDNRSAFEKYLGQMQIKQQASLLHLNLDHFKMINASYGHAAGDEMLRQVCQQLRLALRESDVLARVGGDEFAVLLNPCQTHAAMQTAERLRKSIHDLNVQWNKHNLHTGVSIGVVHIDPSHHHDAQSLLGMADSACKHAKESGRNRITVYDPFNQAFHRYQGDMEWVQRLRVSLENNLFTLLAQTVYPLKPQGKGMQGVHFEVLVRLQDGPGKLISPNEFIPVAERYDLMPQIDRWVVRNTLKLLKAHLGDGANISTCAINLSGASLGDAALLEFIRHNIFEQGVSAEKLCFEITETSAIASMDNAISMIEELRRLGCRFSLDDFGSGMASFKYLQQLPVDYLKIDGSFVRDMLHNTHNYAMVDAINHIGHVMGKRTVAEFVGDDATFAALQDMGVDYAQGYYIAPPVLLNSAYFQRASLPPPQFAAHSSKESQ